ncbi:MAG: response regulator [Verrucomicrobiota bacterium]
MAGFPHIAVVDDEEAIVDILGYTLNKKFPDARITGFNNAPEALEWLGKNQVDLLLTDLHMPGLNGKEIVAMMEQNRPHTPVVVISGAMSLNELKALESHFGNVRVYAKPLLTSELMEGIEAGLAGDGAIPPERLKELNLSDLLHLLHFQKKSVQVSVEGSDGIGGVVLREGELVLAEYNDVQTEGALYQLLELKNPKLSVEPTGYGGDALIRKDFDELFSEYLRRRSAA